MIYICYIYLYDIENIYFKNIFMSSIFVSYILYFIKYIMLYVTVERRGISGVERAASTGGSPGGGGSLALSHFLPTALKTLPSYRRRQEIIKYEKKVRLKQRWCGNEKAKG